MDAYRSSPTIAAPFQETKVVLIILPLSLLFWLIFYWNTHSSPTGAWLLLGLSLPTWMHACGCAASNYHSLEPNNDTKPNLSIQSPECQCQCILNYANWRNFSVCECWNDLNCLENSWKFKTKCCTKVCYINVKPQLLSKLIDSCFQKVWPRDKIVLHVGFVKLSDIGETRYFGLLMWSDWIRNEKTNMLLGNCIF